MAIAPAVPGLEVTIEVDVPLPKHQYENEDVTTAGHEAAANSITRYLAVPSGAEFSIHWLTKAPFDSTIDTYAHVFINGNVIQMPFKEIGDKDGERGYKYTRATSKTEG
jgi:hypothetical protein